MKIAIPISDYNGMNSKVEEHFGRAKYFIIYDSKSKKLKLISPGARVEHKCLPVKELDSQGVDVAYVIGIGSKAISLLKERGITPKTGTYKTIKEVIQNLNSLQDLKVSCGH